MNPKETASTTTTTTTTGSARERARERGATDLGAAMRARTLQKAAAGRRKGLLKSVSGGVSLSDASNAIKAFAPGTPRSERRAMVRAAKKRGRGYTK